ncbi:XRE family transcriptional regulator [Streptomyces venezuelae]|uniref:XRE family transcriptional regulator n=1 Tax=Streptomyces venezuelae TaxID=54571 RepID=A0A5P2C3H1_STRVZ|nr:helix-turn-helix transcriptional regulator [Streptomyces venezuelae]QES36488.1 XRE family transcriptional regulator [Streptomyces venezuelae]
MASNTATSALRSGLGGFLRAHRERLSPGDVGLPVTARRRTSGLRREEVAALSGVSVAWYTWLEQGRVDTSRQVLDAVARALRLDDASHRHALALAGFAPDAAEATGPAVVGSAVEPGLLGMIGRWPDSPAVILGPALDLLAWNRAYADVWPDPAELPDERRNLLLLLVGDASHQRVLPGWESVVVDLYRHLRSRSDRRPGDAGFQLLTARLRDARADLADWWGCRSVGDFAPRTVDIAPRGARPLRAYDMRLLLNPQPQNTGVLVMTPGPLTTPATKDSPSPDAPASGVPRP